MSNKIADEANMQRITELHPHRLSLIDKRGIHYSITSGGCENRILYISGPGKGFGKID